MSPSFRAPHPNPLRHTSFALFALLSVVCLGGCIRRFEQPTLGEPHALAKIRIVYHSVPNGSLRELVLLNEHSIEITPPGARPNSKFALTKAFRMRPGLASWSIRSTFSHQESRIEYEPERVSEHSPCGMISNSAQLPCTSYRPETYEDEERHRVVDASCDVTFEHQARADAKYLLQYDFYEHGRCTLQCIERTPNDTGGFKLSPCL